MKQTLQQALEKALALYRHDVGFSYSMPIQANDGPLAGVHMYVGYYGIANTPQFTVNRTEKYDPNNLFTTQGDKWVNPAGENLFDLFPGEMDLTLPHWWTKGDGEMPTDEERMQPHRLAYYFAGENTAALWSVGDIIVGANFRAHGHGEMDIWAWGPNDTEAQDFASDLNANFGRAVDLEVQKMMVQAQPKVQLLEELAKALKAPLVTEDDRLDFISALGELLLGGIELDNNDTFVIDVKLESPHIAPYVTKVHERLGYFIGNYAGDSLAYWNHDVYRGMEKWAAGHK